MTEFVQLINVQCWLSIWRKFNETNVYKLCTTKLYTFNQLHDKSGQTGGSVSVSTPHWAHYCLEPEFARRNPAFVVNASAVKIRQRPGSFHCQNFRLHGCWKNVSKWGHWWMVKNWPICEISMLSNVWKRIPVTSFFYKCKSLLDPNSPIT